MGKSLASFVTADLHFGHKNIVTFTTDDGAYLRPYSTVEEHDADIIERWNETVRPQDKVYVLGDVVFGKQNLSKIGLLNGRKILVGGNHDNFTAADYLKYFDDVRGTCDRTYNGFRIVMTHVPIHPSSMPRWDLNIHGHLHSEKITIQDYDENYPAEPRADRRYFCASLEQHDMRPVKLDDILRSNIG